MTVDEIRELIQLVSDTGIAELEVQRDKDRVVIKAAIAPQAMQAPVFYGGPQNLGVPGYAAGPSPQALASQEPPKPAKTEPTADPAVKLVKSPIVGTFYECPSPGTPPFVRIGETVQAGRVICIIESMKLMNEIEAEFAGVIESKLVPNGQPVEYGEALFSIRAI
jgi:acetyl-CoA carboxylase biotin carboxyl carrier protein